MPKFSSSMRRAVWCGILAASVALPLWAGARGGNDGAVQAAATSTRPRYHIAATVDYDLLTLQSSAKITVPVAPGDALRDAVFFIYANAGGVGGDDPRHKNIVVDAVNLDGAPLPFTLDGAVLRVKLPQEKRNAFTLQIDSHGVVPRSPAGAGGLADLMGGLGSDVGGLMGGIGGIGGIGGMGGEQVPAKPANVDYGLYTYGNGVLSLGSFWYPSLAVRQNNRWADEAPEGLGDVAFAEMSDYEVAFNVPATVAVAATGEREEGNAAKTANGRTRKTVVFSAPNVRDFAVLMSEDFVVQAKSVDAGGKIVKVEAYTTRANAARAAQAIDVAAHALQIFAKRFGPYAYDNFKIVEGPIRGGAGGMEFSGLTSIASALYGDLGKQLGALAGSLGAGNLDKILGETGDDAPQQDAGNPAGEMLKGLLGQQKEILDSLFEATIAHEVAHQWWAIGVGSDSQRAPFVDESLANYSGILYFENRYGRARAEKMMEMHLRTTYSMGRMLGGGDAPANLKTSAYKNNLQYGAIVYGKGALFYDALRRLIGDEVFFASLRDYYAKYGGRLAAPRAFIETVRAKAPAKAAQVNALFTRWIEQAHGDEDISGGKAMSIDDLLGGLLGGLGAAGQE